MFTSGKRLLLGSVVAAALVGGGSAGAQGTLCIPGVPLAECQEDPPPASGPPDESGQPQPPPPPPPPPPEPCAVTKSKGRGSFTGIVAEQVYGTDSRYRRCALSAIAENGARIMRQPLRWAEIERSRGVYDFEWWDGYVAALATHRIQLLPILFGPPSFRSAGPASGAERGVYPPRRYSQMASFAARAARRYGPTGSFWRAHPELPKVPVRSWQVWNEPNLPFYWLPKPNARAYTKLLAKVGRAIKRVDPRAEIVTAGFPQSTMTGSVSQLRYLRALYRAGAKKHFDTLAIHSYTKTHRRFKRQLRNVRRVMRRARDPARIWITEIGWATGGPGRKYTPGRKGQARRIHKTFRFVVRKRRSLRMRGVVYYMWQDAPPYAGFPDFWGLHTGLLDIAGEPKPALATFRRHARPLARAR